MHRHKADLPGLDAQLRIALVNARFLAGLAWRVSPFAITRHVAIGAAVIVFFGGVPASAQPDYETTRSAAEQGDANAQFNLGLMYGTGRGVRQDEAEAVRWFRLAAEQGNASAQVSLGFMYDTGQGVPQDDAEAVRWYRLAADQGHAGAQGNLGLMYSSGRGVPQDDVEAVRWYRLAADQGDAEAQRNLGLMYAEGQGVPQDEAEAVRWFRLAAEQGDALAQTVLGGMYYAGMGVPKDATEAVRWFRLAAEQDYALAQVFLAILAGMGIEGVALDQAEADRWLRLAAEQDYALVQNSDAALPPDLTAFILLLPGIMYDLGQGVPQDDVEAVRWFRLAAEQGDAIAQFTLGLRHADGRGVPQDDVEAVRWYRLAAEQGDAEAQRNLEWMYANGRGVPDTTLHALQLSEGAPEPGFMFSALAGVLPAGDVSLTPAFEPGSTTTYRAEVSQPLLTIRAHTPVSVDTTATGVTADGTALPIVNQSRLNDVNGNGNFLSVTFGDLAMGENRIQIVNCTIVVTRSAP